MFTFFHLQSSDFVIILNQRRAVDAFSKGGNLTLGGNCTVAVGPLGRYACWCYCVVPNSVARGQKRGNNPEWSFGNLGALSKCPLLSISVVIWNDTFISKVFSFFLSFFIFFIWMHLSLGWLLFKIKVYGLRENGLIYVQQLIWLFFYVTASAAMAMWTWMRKGWCGPWALESFIMFHSFVNRQLKPISLERVLKCLHRWWRSLRYKLSVSFFLTVVLVYLWIA